MNSQYEQSFTQTIWQFLPGILKGLSVLAILSVAFNVFSFSSNQSGDNAKIDADTKTSFPLQRTYNPVFGKKDASVKLIYFVDYQCPACKANAPAIKEIKPNYQDKIEIVYKNFPITQIHPYAKSTAEATQAAIKQDKFFEFTDKIYDLQDVGLTSSNLENLAKQQGLDVGKWNNDRNSREIALQVELDKKDLEKIELPKSSKGIEKKANSLDNIGTPISVLFKDGQVFDWWTGGISIADLNSRLDGALK